MSDNSGDFLLVERKDDTPSTYLSSPGGGSFELLGGALGKVLNEVVATIGKVLGGAGELAVGAFNWILKGVQSLAKDIVMFFGNLFKKNPDDTVPEYLSPIKADLEGAVAPMVESIKESHARVQQALIRIDEIDKKQESLRLENVSLSEQQGKLSSDMEGLRTSMGAELDQMKKSSEAISQRVTTLSGKVTDQAKLIDTYAADVKAMGPKITALEDVDKQLSSSVENYKKAADAIDTRVGALETAKTDFDKKFLALENADKNVGKSIWQLQDFKRAMDDRLAAFKTQMTSDLNVAGQINAKIAEYNNTLNTRLKAGGDIANQIKTAADGAATAGAKGFNDWWTANGQSFLNMQEWYTDWNNQQWTIQKSVNDLQANFNTKVTNVLNTQVKANSQQQTFNAFVTEFAKMQKAYNDTNTGLWKVQEAFNDKTSDLWKYQNDLNNQNSTLWKLQKLYNDGNSVLWKYQKDLNTTNSALWKLQKAVNQDNVDLWGFQKWYNNRNNELWTLQSQWNEKQEQWNKLQEQVNNNRAEWELQQEQLNGELQQTIAALDKAQQDLLAMQEAQFEYIPRKLIARSPWEAVTSNPHFSISKDGRTITALGSWVGEASVRYYGSERLSISSDGGYESISNNFSNEIPFPVPQVDGTREMELTGLPYASSLSTVVVDYYVYQGEPKRSRASGANRVLVKEPAQWQTLNTFEVTTDANHRILFNLLWDGTTYEDAYGVRILLNGSVLASKGPSVRVGPLTPAGNGVRSMNLPEISQQFKPGDVLTFQAYYKENKSRGTSTRERTIRSWDRTVAWIEPPKKG